MTLLSGCGKKEAPADLAPVSSASLEAPKVATAGAVVLVVDAPSSSVKFLMDSPLEKIDGDAPGSASGELSVDLGDLAKSSGLVKIDLDKLSLYQQKRPDGKGEYQERVKNPLQNKHARDWLQLVPGEGDVTAEQAAQNRVAELRIEKVEPSVPSVTALSGPERKVTATVSGTLRLHGRQEMKSAKVELTFRYEGEKFASLGVKTLEPFVVNLDRFEIHPRDAAGKLVKTITESLATNLKGKVKSEAPVEIELTAKPK
ncbi:MAG TPA: YceI family protein [Polyangiaceae bacterium]|nr:YceI family protein [Polyangiaceae bacterium]